MEILWPRLRLSIAPILLAAAALVAACRDSVETTPPADRSETVPAGVEDFLAVAQRMRGLGNFDAAADAVYKALVSDPANVDAMLVASEVEAARGNRRRAVELASSIDIRSRLGKKAVELHAEQLLKLNRTSEAADVILTALQVMPDVPPWRHQVWALLNRVGRREEASQQAEFLCRAGQVTEDELLSLVSRTWSYPRLLNGDEPPEKYFERGLGIARWYFTNQDYRRALEQLETAGGENSPGSATDTAAARALRGRLLAEIQAHEQLPRWHVQCDGAVQELGDYWAALGTFFFDSHQYQASARALLEAVYRNPTDRISIQRLAKVFDALGRPDDAEQFRHRGIQISNTERQSEDLIKSPADLPTRQRLTRELIELGRPFETLQWTLTMLPPGATAERAAVAQQQAQLLRVDEAVKMASESSLIGIDPQQFSLETALASLSRLADSPKRNAQSAEVDTLAKPRLVNVAKEMGLDFQWYQDLEINLVSIPIHESVGGGIAVLDYDLDGWPDVYLAQGSGDPPTSDCTRSNVLFRNTAAQFTAVTDRAGVDDYNYSSGLAAGDVNQDGFADLFLGSLGHNRLLINNGDGTFRDATDVLGDAADRFTSSLAIADISGDGLPDLYEAVYIEMEGAFKLPDVGPDGQLLQPSPLTHFAGPDRWYQNSGDGRFQVQEISRDVAKPGTSLGVVVTDFDSNGSNEVFVGNDVRPNHFLVQAGGNQFYNTADSKGVANGFSGAANGCMGIAPGDFNRDGLIDLHITNFSQESANLYLQSAGGGFTDFAIRYGLDTVSLPLVGFGTKAVDVDRNGWLDLIVTNGHIFDMRHADDGFQMPPQMLMWRGNRFESVPVDDDSGYWDKLYLGRSMATIDFDRDGAIDFLIGHLDQPLALLHNETPTTGQWIQFELVGTASERDAVGARVVVTIGDQQWTQWVTAGDGYFCSDEPLVDFGFATGGVVEKVEIHWPSGTQQTISGLTSGHRYLIIEADAEPVRRS